MAQIQSEPEPSIPESRTNLAEIALGTDILSASWRLAAVLDDDQIATAFEPFIPVFLAIGDPAMTLPDASLRFTRNQMICCITILYLLRIFLQRLRRKYLLSKVLPREAHTFALNCDWTSDRLGTVLGWSRASSMVLQAVQDGTDSTDSEIPSEIVRLIALFTQGEANPAELLKTCGHPFEPRLVELDCEGFGTVDALKFEASALKEAVLRKIPYKLRDAIEPVVASDQITSFNTIDSSLFFLKASLEFDADAVRDIVRRILFGEDEGDRSRGDSDRDATPSSDDVLGRLVDQGQELLQSVQS